MRHETTGKDGDWKRVRGDGNTVKVKYDNTGIDFSDEKESFFIGPGYFGLRNVATASLPVSPSEGAFVYDSTVKAPVVHNGTDYKTLLASASGNVELSQIEDIASDRVLGRDTAGSGAVEQLTVGNGLEFTGSGGLRRSALSGEVAASAGSNTTSITLSPTSWTPVLLDTSINDSESQAYVNQEGSYIKIGDAYFIKGRLTMSNLGTLSGSVYIGGLPSDPDFANGIGSFTFGYADGLSITAGQVVTGTAVVVSSSPVISLRLWDATTGASNLQISELTNGADFQFSGFYFV